MRLLLDTQILLWLSSAPSRISPRSRAVLVQSAGEAFFSPISLVEIAIKRHTRSANFLYEPSVLRTKWIEDGLELMPFLDRHALAMAELPTLHKDPFDRMLLAQAVAKNLTLLTADDILTRYPSHVMDAR